MAGPDSVVPSRTSRLGLFATSPCSPDGKECEMPQLPPDDQPDTIQIGPVDSIPVFHEDDPRLEGERRRWARARAKAQAMQTTDELLVGLEDPDWRVRHETVTRLISKARHDHRTLGTLLRLLREDRAWQVRDAVATRLHEF